MGEEQQLFEVREGDVEKGGEQERGSTVREKTVEMATSTMPWHSSGYNFLPGRDESTV